MHLKPPNTPLDLGGQDPDPGAVLEGAAPQRARDDRSRAVHGENPVDGKPGQVFLRPSLRVLGCSDQGSTEILQPGADCRRRADDRRTLEYGFTKQVADVFGSQLEPFLVDQVALGQGHDHRLHPQKPNDVEMLSSLGHDPFVGGHHQEHDVDPGRAGEHVADEALVSGHVDDAELHALTGREFGEPEVDRDPSLLLLPKPIRVHTRECSHEGGLAVIDVPRGAEDERAAHHASSRGPVSPASSDARKANDLRG